MTKFITVLLFLLLFVKFGATQNPQYYTDLTEYYKVYDAKSYYEIGNSKACANIFDTIFVDNPDFKSPIGILTAMKCYSSIDRKKFMKIAKYGEELNILKKGKRKITFRFESITDTLLRILYEDQGINLDENYRNHINNMGKGILLTDLSPLDFNNDFRKHIEIVSNIIDSDTIIADDDYSYLGKRAIYLTLIHSEEKQLLKYSHFVKQNFKPSDYAYFHDKLCAITNQPQVYGTQTYFNEDSMKEMLYKVNSSIQLDSLRMTVDLEPIKYYAKKMNFEIE